MGAAALAFVNTTKGTMKSGGGLRSGALEKMPWAVIVLAS